MTNTAHALMLAGIDSAGLARKVPTSGLPQLGQLVITVGEDLPPPEICDASNDYCGALGPDDGGGATPPPGFVAPGAVPVVLAAWDLDATPPRYQLQNGDTFVGLAATYLGDGGRWLELWQAQTPNYRASHTADAIFAGEIVNMTKEAADNLRSWIDKGEPPGSTPGQIATQKKVDKMRGGGVPTWAKYAAGVAAAGGLIWWITS